MDTFLTSDQPFIAQLADLAIPRPRRRRAAGVSDSGHVVGQDHHRARHSDHDVWLMCELRDAGMTLQSIADKFETSKGTIHDITTGRRRGHSVTGQKFASQKFA